MKLRKLTEIMSAVIAAMLMIPMFAEGEYYGEGGSVTPEINISSHDISIPEPSKTEGNMILIDEAVDENGTRRLFYTVETRNGNTFYIVIDRDALGRENVHFLNQVDDADLMRILDDEETTALPETTLVEVPEPMYVDTTEAEETTAAENEKTTASDGGFRPRNLIIIFLTAAVLGGGFAFWYFRIRGGGRQKTGFEDDEDGGEEDDR